MKIKIDNCIAQKRHRFARGFVYDPSSKDKKIAIQQIKEQFTGKQYTDALKIRFVFHIKRPKAHFITCKYANELKKSAPVYHTKRPDVDNFVDTSVQPAVQVNFDGNYDAWENMANAWGTDWGSWENVGAANVSTSSSGNLNPGGGGLSTTTTTEQRQTRQGIQTTVTPNTQTQNLGEKVINTNIAWITESLNNSLKC